MRTILLHSPLWGKCCCMLFFFGILFHSKAQATYYIFHGTGYWTDANRWTPGYPGLTINFGDTVEIEYERANCTIPTGVTVTINGTIFLASTETNLGEIQNNGTMLVGTFTFNNNGSLINHGSFINNGNFFNNGRLENDSNSRFVTEFLSFVGGFVYNEPQSEMEILPGGKLTVSSNISLSGTIKTNGPLVIAQTGGIDFGGDWQNNSVITDSGKLDVIYGARFNNGDSGSINLSMNGQILNSGEFSNYGSVSVCNGCTISNGMMFPRMTNFGTFSVAGLLTNDPAGTFINSGPETVKFVPGERRWSVTQGTLTIGPLGTFNNNSVCINKGFIYDGGAFNSTDSFHNANSLTVLGEGAFINSGYADNTGAFTVSGGGSVTCTQPLFSNKAYTYIYPNSQFNITVGGFISLFGSSLAGYNGQCNCYVITFQPGNVRIGVGGTAGITVDASSGAGPGPIGYRWEFSPDGSNWKRASGPHFSGDTTSAFYIDHVPLSFNNYQFRCLVSGPQPGNQVYSNISILEVIENSRKR